MRQEDETERLERGEEEVEEHGGARRWRKVEWRLGNWITNAGSCHDITLKYITFFPLGLFTRQIDFQFKVQTFQGKPFMLSVS